MYIEALVQILREWTVHVACRERRPAGARDLPRTRQVRRVIRPTWVKSTRPCATDFLLRANGAW
jgi:hypothetical protein